MYHELDKLCPENNHELETIAKRKTPMMWKEKKIKKHTTARIRW